MAMPSGGGAFSGDDVRSLRGPPVFVAVGFLAARVLGNPSQT